MANLKNNVLEHLKKQYLKGNPNHHGFQTTSKTKEYYLNELNDNLYLPMSEGAKGFYKNGSGNEIDSGKMNALHSSSAMTYNLLWDLVAEVNNGGEFFGNGVYQVELEKQYRPLKKSPNPSNLDAFLYNKHTKEAVACEMKMTEWLSAPGMLREAYFEAENYPANGEVFVKVAKALTKEETKVDKNGSCARPVIFSTYDAAQMFKHTAACYAAICSKQEPREIKTLTLVNCVWSYPCDRWTTEVEEFKAFKSIMEPIVRAFDENLHVKFKIKFLSFNNFLKTLKKTDEELTYLKRYDA